MLVFFGWTTAEAVILYYKLVKVLGEPIEYFVQKAALIVWLVPLLITVISVGPGYKHYINPYYCRATQWPFWFGLIVPFCIMYIFNWIIFITIMIQLIHRRNFAGNIKPKNRTATLVKQNLFIAIGLSLLFGLGWGFGLTATSSDYKELTFAFQILFSLFVGSQGVLIFILHGIRSPQFRKVWVTVFGLRKALYSLTSQKKHVRPGSSSTFNMIASRTLQSGSSKDQHDDAWKPSSQGLDSELGLHICDMPEVIADREIEEVGETEKEESEAQ